MATPLNTSALLQVDSDSTSETFVAGFTFTAGNDATAQFSHYNSNTSNLISSVTIGGTTATRRARVGGTGKTELYDAFNIAGGTDQVVVTYTGGTGHYVSGGVQEWAASDGLAYDTGTANTATGSSTSPSVSTAASTSQANTVVIASAVGGAGDVNINITGPTGWTALWTEQNGSTHVPGRAAYHEETSAGTKTATFSIDNSAWAAAIAAYTVTGGTQTLTPSLFTNSQTFYAPTVSRGAVSLVPSLVTNAQTFFAPTVSSTYGLTPGLVTNAQVFYGPVAAAGIITLAPSLVTNGQIFYGPVVSLASGPQELLPPLVTNAQTFYGATVTASYALTPGLLTNAQTFYAPSVSASNDLSPALVTNTAIFYAATISSGAVTLQPALVTNTQVFYGPTVLQQSNVELLPGLLTNEQSFFSPTAALVPQAQTQFGGWFTSAPTPMRSRKERDEERQRLGILPAAEVPVTPAEVRELTHEDRQRAHRMAKKLLERFAPEPSAPIAAVALPAPNEQPTIGPVELPMEVQATLVAAQKKRAFEQDLVYIVAALIS